MSGLRAGAPTVLLHDAERAARWVGKHERCWPAELAIVVAVGLYMVLPAGLLLGPRYLLPALEVLLLFAIRGTAVRPEQAARRSSVVLSRHADEAPRHRFACIALILLVTVSNAITLALLSMHILNHANGTSGKQLLLAALAIWVTNVLVSALWYWETDRGGPGKRSDVNVTTVADFRFPQEDQDATFKPSFVDYLYLGFTNATAFSPTDALPVTHRAKLAMMLQSLVSLLTVLLVAARAVNILN